MLTKVGGGKVVAVAVYVHITVVYWVCNKNVKKYIYIGHLRNVLQYKHIWGILLWWTSFQENWTVRTASLLSLKHLKTEAGNQWNILFKIESLPSEESYGALLNRAS